MTEPRESITISEKILGMHHVRIPVSDPWRSRDWYISTFGFTAVLDLEDSDRVVGVLLRHPCGLVVSLHQDSSRAAAMAGFPLLGLTVADQMVVEECAAELTRLEQRHSRPQEGHVGWYVDVEDPDGIVVRLHSPTVIDSEDV